MAKTIVVNGFGPGISAAVAERFGKAGYQVALVARNAERLAAGVKALEAKGIKAQAFATDLGNPDAVKAMIASVQKAFGSIDVLQWNAYGSGAGNLLTADAAELRGVFDVPVMGLTLAVQAALADLKKNKGALLVTNGGLGFFDAAVDGIAVEWNAMGLAIANSAKHKVVRLLSKKLAAEGVYVGEVVVTGTVKGTAFDRGNAALDPHKIAERFWSMLEARKDTSTVM